MKFLKIISLIIVFAVILLSLDCIYINFNKDSDLLRWPKSFKIGSSKSSVKSGQGISPYIFTEPWFVMQASDWENHLKGLKGKPNSHALEIGSFEGLSAIWQVENILTDPTSTITCIDIFDDKVIEERFDKNIKATGVSDKVIKIKGPSEKMLRGLKLEHYDYVYIDGSHVPKWVLSDAVLSWDLLKKGGLMIFDDYRLIDCLPRGFRPTKIDFIDYYLWRRWWGGWWARIKHDPAIAIDAFIKIYGPYLEVVFKKYQVVVKKL